MFCNLSSFSCVFCKLVIANQTIVPSYLEVGLYKKTINIMSFTPSLPLKHVFKLTSDVSKNQNDTQTVVVADYYKKIKFVQ